MDIRRDAGKILVLIDVNEMFKDLWLDSVGGKHFRTGHKGTSLQVAELIGTY